MSNSARTLLVILDGAGPCADGYRQALQQDPNGSYEVLVEPFSVQTLEHLGLGRSPQVDAILLDLQAADADSLEGLRQLQDILGDRPGCPPIVVMGENDARKAVGALRQGAADYLVRDQVTPDELWLALQSAIEKAQLSPKVHINSEHLRRVLNSLFSFVGVMTPNGVLIEANQAALTAASLQPADVLGLPFEQAYWWSYSPDVQAQLKDAIERAKAGETVRYDVQVRLGEERFIVIDFALVPLLDEEGRVEYLIPSGIDISDRQRAEASLRESQAQLQQQLAEIESIYQSAPIGLNVLDRNLRFVRINQRLAEINGLSVEAHIGHTIRELLPDLADTSEQLLRPVLETGEPLLNVEISGETPAHPGVKRTWLEHFLPLKDGDRVIGISTVCQEITERKQMENARERLLEQEQLARERAERANRIKDEFLAILSHELRTPLNPILGWAKLLQVRKLGEGKVAEALASIERNARLQVQLVEDLLDTAKILRGQLNLNVTPIDLVSILKSSMEAVASAAAAKSISLQSDLPDLGPAVGDAGRLHQIFWNLLSNAIKFTPAGGRVELRLQRVGNQVEVTVTDTGKGIPSTFLPHIFEAFRQEDTSSTRQHGGLGLGLAIVRYLVEAHGGIISASSPGDGMGTTFIVQLPLQPGVLELSQDEALPEQMLDLAGVRVLVVDDEPDSRELVVVVLNHYGAEALAVASAAEALAALESFQPTILISDIGMPQMDGYSLIQCIRALPAEKGGEILAIALTAHARDTDSQRALSSGYQCHMAKPLEPEQVVQQIWALTHPHQNCDLVSPSGSIISPHS